MNSQEIIDGISEYERLKLERARHIQIMDGLKELEQNPSVNQYIELARSLNMLKEIKFDNDEELAFKAFHFIAQDTKKSNQIYVFMGTYIQNLFGKDIRTYINICSPQHYAYNLYLDLETMKERKISLSIFKEFENKNIIIKPHYRNFEECKRYYNNLRTEFLSQLVKDSQEDVVHNFVKKYGTKI